MNRKHLTRSQRAGIFEAHSGICHLCGLRIQAGERWELEHIQALGLGGADDVANMAPAHVRCHQGKTNGEKTTMAKADRQKWFHMGIRKPPSRWLPGSKASGWKHKLTGGWVRR